MTKGTKNPCATITPPDKPPQQYWCRPIVQSKIDSSEKFLFESRFFRLTRGEKARISSRLSLQQTKVLKHLFQLGAVRVTCPLPADQRAVEIIVGRDPILHPITYSHHSMRDKPHGPRQAVREPIHADLYSGSAVQDRSAVDQSKRENISDSAPFSSSFPRY